MTIAKAIKLHNRITKKYRMGVYPCGISFLIENTHRNHITRCSYVLVMVEMRGVEPLSENRSMRLSPGAASDWISPSSVSGAKPTAGSHFVRDRFNGETPMHGHRYMTLRRGSRSSLGERAALLSRGTALRLPEQQYCCRLILKVGQLTGLPGLTRLSHFMIPVETGTPPGDYFESMPQNKMMCDVCDIT